MPSREHDGSSIISVRVPDALLYRLDRVLDDLLIRTGQPLSRNAVVREALTTWVEEREGLYFSAERWIEQFCTAYRTVGQGRQAVYIHQMRDALHWPRERFDRVLEQLRASYAIELHEGDPRHLSLHEIENSYEVAGVLYVTMSWRA